MNREEDCDDVARQRISEWIDDNDAVATLDLKYIGLTHVPILPTDLTRVELCGNQITRIESLPANLQYINLDRNQIEYIDRFPDSLDNLCLSQNRLTSLPHLPDSIEWLDISYNSIQTLPNVPEKLETLFCWGNPMRRDLIEEWEPIYQDYYFHYHVDRIELWRNYIANQS